jgi:hypothetical protein
VSALHCRFDAASPLSQIHAQEDQGQIAIDDLDFIISYKGGNSLSALELAGRGLELIVCTNEKRSNLFHAHSRKALCFYP